MKSRDLAELGIPSGPVRKLALQTVGEALKQGMSEDGVRSQLAALAESPSDYVEDSIFGTVAKALVERDAAQSRYVEREHPAPYQQWGRDLESGAVEQMHHACRLPVAVAGALMPDAHQGYGLPIGGVLATKNSVIPYAVGVDIACRMKMTVFDLPATALEQDESRLQNAIERETRFGIGASFRKPRQHQVMDEDWSVTDVTGKLKDKAWSQLGTSGSGNHFVEFGTLELAEADLGLEAGTYLALLSHSGSRGSGAGVASHYSSLAMQQHPELPRELMHLAWLNLDSEAGQEYWQAMQLMGLYAAANHEVIHRTIVEHLGVEVLADVENHHNFAWKENHYGEELIVHRKGATPAGDGVLGIIPGSMGTPGYVVRGKGSEQALLSASHGAGRKMSRTAAKKRFTWQEAKAFLKARKVKLMSAGLDEVPMAYKDIDEVMRAQADLVDCVARFQPRLVKMAPAGERPED